MNRRHGRLAVAAGSLVLLATGCGDGSVAGGGSSGSEAGNSITIQVLRPDGMPASGAEVRVRASNHLRVDSSARPQGMVLDSTYADLSTGADGAVVAAGLREGSYRIEALDGEHAGQVLATSSTRSGTRATIVLGPTGTVSGRIEGGRSGAWIGLLGSDHRTRTDSDGAFRMSGLPAGNASLRAIAGTERGFQVVRPRESATVGILRPEVPAGLFLDDFEDGDTYHRYAPISGRGWWYAAMASSLASVPDDIAGNPENALMTDAATGNRFLEWSVSNPGNIAEGWAEFGVGLGAAPVDLRKLTSISFRVRGSGVVQVRIHSSRLLSKQFFGSAVALTPDWTDVTVALGAFKVEGPGADTVDASALLDSCSGIAWSFGPAGKIALDDIRLTGIDAITLWGELIAP